MILRINVNENLIFDHSNSLNDWGLTRLIVHFMPKREIDMESSKGKIVLRGRGKMLTVKWLCKK